MKLEVFRSQGPPSRDLALEAELLARASCGHCSALLASWPGPVVVLGYAQKAEDVDLEWCRRSGIPVLRRQSGGTGVIHRGDLGVALALPKEHPWSAGIVGLYDRFLNVLEPALTQLGSRVERIAQPRRGNRVRSPICFEDQLADTLVVEGRKAVGCSQARRGNGVLIHAAVLLDLDVDLYSRIFGVDKTRVRQGLAPAISGVPWTRVADAVVDRMGEELGLEIGVSQSPVPSPEFIESYEDVRWAPVPDGGMPGGPAALV